MEQNNINGRLEKNERKKTQKRCAKTLGKSKGTEKRREEKGKGIDEYKERQIDNRDSEISVAMILVVGMLQVIV